MKVTIKRLHPDAILPVYAHGSHVDAGMDLCALESVAVAPGHSYGVGTGIAIALPIGYEAQVRPRSGLGLKHAIAANFGTVDPGYRGEIRVVLFNHGSTPYRVEKGDRIAQLVVSRYERVTWINGDLDDTARGDGGFGSTGQ